MSGCVKEKNQPLSGTLIIHISACLTFKGDSEQYTYRPPSGSNHTDCNRGTSSKDAKTLWCKDWKGGGWIGRAEERRKWTKQQSKIDWRLWIACGHPPTGNKIKDLKFTSSAYLEQTLSICGHVCATPNFRQHFRLQASKQSHKV